ncbi:hypothetical protein CEXT_322561 [Caerostris extrusa]|uniref:Uncharacterized protein n=1 Tax=Caerostris extrusa TaxID=172846 RepID=A0AAV4W500_CAEEX|nr:hypothetical protein CEXT_322561 [Caerostris extrusa]
MLISWSVGTDKCPSPVIWNQIVLQLVWGIDNAHLCLTPGQFGQIMLITWLLTPLALSIIFMNQFPNKLRSYFNHIHESVPRIPTATFGFVSVFGVNDGQLNCRATNCVIKCLIKSVKYVNVNVLSPKQSDGKHEEQIY